MIYTVTLNPSLDYILHVDSLRLGEVNRADRESITFGGKGINVSIILQQLRCENVTLGFTAGLTGDVLQSLLKTHGCQTDFISLPQGLTRINVKLSSRQETEINASGPRVDQASVEALYRQLDALPGPDTTLVLSGSVPSSLPDDIYETILHRLSGRGIRFVVDAEGNLLFNVLKYRPFLIKPNHLEVAELFGCSCDTREEIIACAKKLQELGAQNVLVSRAGDGAILLTREGQLLSCSAPKVRVVNSSGAGDSMLAGFLAGYSHSGGDYAQALVTGIAAGSATAASVSLASREKILALREKLETEWSGNCTALSAGEWNIVKR